MSDYDKRFNLCMGLVSSYHDTAAEVLGHVRRFGGNGEVRFITEGYADHEDVPDTSTQIGGTIVTRRTLRTLTLDEVKVIAARDAVEAEVARLKAAA